MFLVLLFAGSSYGQYKATYTKAISTIKDVGFKIEIYGRNCIEKRENGKRDYDFYLNQNVDSIRIYLVASKESELDLYLGGTVRFTFNDTRGQIHPLGTFDGHQNDFTQVINARELGSGTIYADFSQVEIEDITERMFREEPETIQPWVLMFCLSCD